MKNQFEDIQFPGWEIVRKLGEGSFGGVYEIQRTLPDGRVERGALKKLSVPRDREEIEEMLSKSFSTESITAHYKDQMGDLVREYSLMQELGICGNVVTCHDIQYIQQEGGLGWDVYIRMELLRPLKKALGQEYREETVLKLGLDLCNALKACQKKNIIHRDIKPENILVSEDGTFKLTDFGIAKVSEKTGSGTLAGTNGYMAPEVANRQHYGASADQYSLGMVLYWMMNKRTLPFLPLPPEIPTAKQRQDAVNRRFNGEPLPPPVHGSSELKQIVQKACAFSPAHRYQSIQEFSAALEACCEVQTAETNEETVQLTEASLTGKFSPAVFNEENEDIIFWKELQLDTQPEAVQETPKKPDSARHPSVLRKKRKKTRKNLVLVLVAILAVLMLLLGWMLLQLKKNSSEKRTLDGVTIAPPTTQAPAANVETVEATVETTMVETMAVPMEDTAAPAEEPYVSVAIPSESELYSSADYLKVKSGDNLFAIMPHYFSFSSGVGGWSTQLDLYEDGTFDGYYSDWNMGEMDEDYFRGTCRLCAFSGEFSTPRKVTDYVYTVSIKSLDYPGDVGAEWIEDDTRFIQSTPYGLDESSEYYIYLPGCPYSVFKSEQLPYIGRYDSIPQGRFAIYAQDGSSWLGFWGSNGESVFFSDYRYQNGEFQSTLDPKSYDGKSKITFEAEDDKVRMRLSFDWMNESQRTFVAEDENGSGEYDVNLYFKKDLQSVVIDVQSRQGVSLKDWGGTEDGHLTAEYSAVTYNPPAETDGFQLKKSEVKAGDYVYFGKFEQDNNPDNGEEPIEWRILALDKSGKKALLLSHYALTARPYHNGDSYPTWANSNIRGWLNGWFFRNAFTEQEQAAIVRTKQSNASYEGIEGGLDTWDRVFLLSRREAATYFAGSPDRLAEPTEYARANGVATADENGRCWWWLRTPGAYAYDAGTVYAIGSIDHTGANVKNGTIAVRPAIWVELSD